MILPGWAHSQRYPGLAPENLTVGDVVPTPRLPSASRDGWPTPTPAPASTEVGPTAAQGVDHESTVQA